MKVFVATGADTQLVASGFLYLNDVAGLLGVGKQDCCSKEHSHRPFVPYP